MLHGPYGNILATYHPAAVLRAPDGESREQMKQALIDDLRTAAELVRSRRAAASVVDEGIGSRDARSTGRYDSIAASELPQNSTLSACICGNRQAARDSPDVGMHHLAFAGELAQSSPRLGVPPRFVAQPGGL